MTKQIQDGSYSGSTLTMQPDIERSKGIYHALANNNTVTKNNLPNIKSLPS